MRDLNNNSATQNKNVTRNGRLSPCMDIAPTFGSLATSSGDIVCVCFPPGGFVFYFQSRALQTQTSFSNPSFLAKRINPTDLDGFEWLQSTF